MIGGTVIETIVLGDAVWVNCRDTHSTSECAIYVELTDKARSISEGDTVWWQSGHAYWTPGFYIQKSGRGGKDYDIKLKRIGCSGVKRPKKSESQKLREFMEENGYT